MRKKLTNNMGYKILSVIFAIMLWLIVLNVNDPQKTTTVTNIPITIVNEDAVTGQDKVYEIISGKTATVEVTGPRTIVDSLEASDFEASADLSKLSMTNAVEVDVELKTASYRSKVDIDVQTTLRISVEDLLEEEYSIGESYRGSVPEGYVVYDTVIADEKVTVKAPVSVMNKIASVAAQIDVTGAVEDFSSTVELYAYDSRGNIIDAVENNITFSKAHTKADVVIYSVKQIPVTYEIVEADYGNIIFTGTTISREHIMIAGRKEDIEAVSELKLDTTGLEFTEDEVNYVFTYDIKTLLPENVHVYGDDKTLSITVTTDAIITRSYTVSIEDIAVKSPAEGYTAYIETTGEITYTLRGRKSTLDAFESAENTLYVSAKNLVQGVYNVEVLMDIDEDIQQIGTVNVIIKVVPKDDISNDPTSEQESDTTQNNVTTENTTTADNQETSSSEGETTSDSGNTDTEGEQ